MPGIVHFFEPTARVFQGLRLLSHTRRPHEVVRHLLSELGIWDHFRKEPERTANIEQLISFFQEQDPAHMYHHDALRSLVEYASLAKNVDHIARSRASVIVVPVHQSKGLEFDTVFIAGAVEGMMPLFFAKTQKELEEEKRVFYVALTWPKKRLYISGYKRFIARNRNVMRKEMSNYVARLGQNVEYV